LGNILSSADKKNGLCPVDESLVAYKPMDEIIENIRDTVESVDIIKPIYNFKVDE